MRKSLLRLVLAVSTFLLIGSAYSRFDEYAPPSFADHLHLSKDPIDGGWLANLTGLPDQAVVILLGKQIEDLVNQEEENRCNAIDPRLRRMVFQHFAVHQKMANAQNIYFDDDMAHKWAHVLGMILKESDGDPTAIEDMAGRTLTTYKAQSDLRHWRNILKLSVDSHPVLNYQTNFGLTQTSTDRLFLAFKLAGNQVYDTEYLEGKEGADTPRKFPLNTSIAIRRLIWFYQDFSQGRTKQSDMRIYQKDIYKPDYFKRYRQGLRMAILYCGTAHLYKTPTWFQKVQFSPLDQAMASIAYCKLGNAQKGYGKNEINEKCFAQWVTLCPALNIDIAMLTPLKYFQTKNEKPVCENTFKRLINKNPNAE